MPTIAELLTSYRDRTGYSYEDMARKVGNEINRSRLHALATSPPREFPKHPRTIELLAELLQVSIPTILNGFAAGLGLTVEQRDSQLALTLPPGTDNLAPSDVEAIRAVIRQLVAARRALADRPLPTTDQTPVPDYQTVQGIRLDETSPNLRVVEKGANGPEGL